MKWFKRLGSIALASVLAFGGLLPSASAYTGGLLQGKGISYGTNLDMSENGLTNGVTDGSETSSVVSYASGSFDTLWYKFSSPHTITDYQLKADSTSGLALILYDSLKNVIFDSSIHYGALKIDGLKYSTLTNYSNITYVALVNKGTTVRTIYEFDVFGSPSAPAPIDYSGGLLDGVSMNLGTDQNDISGSIGNATDNDETTSFSQTNTYNYTWYEFSELKTINAIRVLANAAISVYAYNSSGAAIGSISATIDGTQTIVDWSNVSKIAFRNMSGSAYVVSEYNVYGSSSAPEPTDTTPPGEITGLTETHTDTSINFDFTVPTDSDFAGTKVYKDGVYVTTLTNTSSFYEARNLEPETEYTYKFTTIDDTGNESTGVSSTVTTNPVPIVDTTPPGEVTELQETHTHESIILSWVNPVDTDYVHTKLYVNGVYRTSIEGTTYEDTLLSPNTAYEYKLTTIDSNANESTGVILSVTTNGEPTAPSKPSKVVYQASGGSVTLTWDQVAGATTYRVYRVTPTETTALESLVFDTAYAESVELLGETGETSYTITGLDEQEEYQFQVSAVNAIGESEGQTITVRTSVDVVTDWTIPFTASDIITNTIAVVASLGPIILLSLAIYFAPRIIDLVKKAAS